VSNSPLAGSAPIGARVGSRSVTDSWGALVLAASLPFVFMHERFQPAYDVGLGSTTVELRLADAAIALVLVAAVVFAVREGLGRLQPAWFLWFAGAALLAWVAFETLRPASVDDALFDDHLVSALKLGEYSALALAVPLLVRRLEDLTILLSGIVLWSAIAAAVAVVQFFGLDIFEATSAGWRYPSFLGRHDLAALCALAACLGLAAIVVSRAQATSLLALVALAGGVVGLVLAGSVTAAAGFALGAAALLLAARKRFAPSARQIVAVIAIVAVVGAGVAAVRSQALEDFLHFVGIRQGEQVSGVESYSQRTVLAYIGLRIFEDHPVAGIGWQRSSRPDAFEPYLADAHTRFPDVVELAFPSPEHPWGVQNLYVQMLADGGVIGLALLLALGAAGLVLAWRTARSASRPWAIGAGLGVICGLLTLGGVWASLGIVAGIPLQAATSLLLGLAAAGAATLADETRA
jgi:O-antigen ligase